MEVDMFGALLATGKLPHLRSLELVCKVYASHATADVLPAAVARLTCLTQLVIDILGAPEQRFADPVPLLGSTLPQLQHLSSIRSLSLARIADDLDRIEVSKLTDVYEHMPLLESLELVVWGLGPRTVALGRALRAAGQLTYLKLEFQGEDVVPCVTHADQLCAELCGLATLESLVLLLPDDRGSSEPGHSHSENVHEAVDLPVLSRLSFFSDDDRAPFPDIRKCSKLRQLDGQVTSWVRAMVHRGYKGGVQKLSLHGDMHGETEGAFVAGLTSITCLELESFSVYKMEGHGNICRFFGVRKCQLFDAIEHLRTLKHLRMNQAELDGEDARDF